MNSESAKFVEIPRLRISQTSLGMRPNNAAVYKTLKKLEATNLKYIKNFHN